MTELGVSVQVYICMVTETKVVVLKNMSWAMLKQHKNKFHLEAWTLTYPFIFCEVSVIVHASSAKASLTDIPYRERWTRTAFSFSCIKLNFQIKNIILWNSVIYRQKAIFNKGTNVCPHGMCPDSLLRPTWSPGGRSSGSKEHHILHYESTVDGGGGSRSGNRFLRYPGEDSLQQSLAIHYWK